MMADLVTGEQHDKLFLTFQQEPFHPELKHAPTTPPPSRTPVCELTERRIGRLRLDHTVAGPDPVPHRHGIGRVISEPSRDYIRWEHSLTPLNLEAGEVIHWLPRRLHSAWPPSR
ncbi:DUF6879 family protein [Streptomyces niveus]|uniref:DUF6879 family protein n=1 Tax=Streptomyces niveus TaxID=193462 RepID=UPI003867C0CC